MISKRQSCKDIAHAIEHLVRALEDDNKDVDIKLALNILRTSLEREAKTTRYEDI